MLPNSREINLEGKFGRIRAIARGNATNNRVEHISRFLTMLAHLILTLTLLLSREENVKACLPFDFTQEDFDRKDVELAAGLGVAVGRLGSETSLS